MESCSATLSLTGLPLLNPSGHFRPNSPRIRSGRNCIAGAISGARPESSDTGSAPSAGRSRGPDRRSRRAVDAPDVLDHRVRVQRSYKRFLIASDSAHASPCSTGIHEGPHSTAALCSPRGPIEAPPEPAASASRFRRGRAPTSCSARGTRRALAPSGAAWPVLERLLVLDEYRRSLELKVAERTSASPCRPRLTRGHQAVRASAPLTSRRTADEAVHHAVTEHVEAAIGTVAHRCD